MKTSTKSRVHYATETTGTSVSCGQLAGSTRLKLLIGLAAVTAAWLTYQAVAETLVLHRLMDEATESVAAKPVVRYPPKNQSVYPDSKSFETNGVTAVLLN